MTVPPIASPSISGKGDLKTSIPSNISGEINDKSTDLSLAELAGILTPFTVIALNFGSNPLITILVPSPPLLFIATPGSLAMASAAFTSGNSCILSEETMFAMDSALNC